MTQIQLTDYANLQSLHELDVYGKRGPTLVGGKGAVVWDDQGRAYIDCIAGNGAAGLGHGHARVIQAVEEQVRKLISCPNAFSNDTRALYLEQLTLAAPEGLNRAFLCNSGTEAVEAGLKFCRISTGRTGIIAAKGGFHGRTYGAMSATFTPQYAEGSKPLVPGFFHIPFNNIEALRQAVQRSTAGVILEIVQGEGGVILGEAAFLHEARRLCDQYGALLIIDEVQTGFCRTGRMFASEHFRLQPDILCLAKSMAAGLPMGAVLVKDHIQIPKGRHGSTFGGNPLACAAARAALEVMQKEDLAKEAARKGDYLVRLLLKKHLQSIREIRHSGLMIGIELKCRVRPMLKDLMQQGVLALPAGSTVLRLLPPLVITMQEIDQVVEALNAVLR